MSSAMLRVMDVAFSGSPRSATTEQLPSLSDYPRQPSQNRIIRKKTPETELAQKQEAQAS